MTKKRVLTGARPSGSPHLGNYFGAFKPAVSLQEKYQLFFFLADFHALNTDMPPTETHTLSLDLTATMLACGLNPKESLFYAQSTVPEVNELAWLISCQAPVGMLMRAHSYKDAVAKGVEVNMGVFNYPILMAADILLYDANIVPVGKDQKQHLEMTRDLALRLNNRYGDLLTIPEPLISDDVAVVPGTDGQKMSKSKKNVVSLFANDKTWKQQIMSIVTDTKTLEEPKDPSNCHVFALCKLMATESELKQLEESYRRGGFGYGHAKLALLDLMKTNFGSMRDEYFRIRSDEGFLLSVLKDGSDKARVLAKSKLKQIQKAIGVIGGDL